MRGNSRADGQPGWVGCPDAGDRGGRPGPLLRQHDRHPPAPSQDRRGRPGRVVRGRRGGAVRPPRTQRRRQDDDDQDADDPAAAHLGARPRPRARRRRRAARGAAQRRLRLRRRPRPLRPAQRPRQPALLQPSSTASAPTGSASASTSCSTSSACEAARTNGSRATPGVCGSASTSPAACSTTPPCCSSTSRPSASTRSAPASCAPSSATSGRRQDRAAHHALHVRGGRAVRPHRRHPLGHASSPRARPPAQGAVSAGHVLEVEAYGVSRRRRSSVRALAGVRSVSVEEDGQAQRLLVQVDQGVEVAPQVLGAARRHHRRPGRHPPAQPGGRLRRARRDERERAGLRW